MIICIRRVISKSKKYFRKCIIVPEPFEALTSENVLTMEYIEGKPFMKGLEEVLINI